jgi:ElaB/YqjD/DUF883 family membrane-anchored ribosome-binding protein
MTGTDDTPREPEDFQRESEAIRAEMNRTLSALERKLSPRQLLDRSLDFMQANGGEVLQKIGATVNKNPLPLLLTSAGLIWLVAASRSSSSTKHRFDKGPLARGTSSLSTSSASTASMSMRSGDFDRSSQSFDTTSMQRKAGRLKQRASRTLDATRSRASRTWGATRDRTQELGQNLNGLVREQPLVCGAVALAVGAIIGAAFPASAYERDLVARARQAGSDMLDDISAQAGNQPLTGTATEQPPPISH